ncbi:MAG: STAS domain-containing protein [Cyanobacteria bacterium P01_E01_bin.45]
MVSVQAWICKAVSRAKQDERASLFEQIFAVVSLILYLDAMFGVMFGGFSASVTKLLFLGSYAIVTGLLLTRYRERLRALLPHGGAIWVVALLPVLSTLWSDYPAVTFPRGLAVLQASLFGLYLGLRFSLPALLHLLGYTLMGLLGASLLALAGLSWWGDDAGVFANTNAFGLRMVLGAIVFLLLALESRMWRRRAWFLLFAVSIVCAFLSGSVAARECATVVLVSIPAIAIPRWRDGPVLTAFLYLISILFGCIVFALVENAESLLGVLKLDSPFSGAIAAEPEVIAAIEHQFLVGYGYENFWVGSLDSPSETLSQLARAAADMHLHSGILESMLNVGFFGTLCVCVCLWSALLNFFKAVRIKRSAFHFFPILFFCLFLFSNFTEYSFYGRNTIFWVLFVSVLTLAADRSSHRSGSQTLLSSVRSQPRYNTGGSLGPSPTTERWGEADSPTPSAATDTAAPQDRSGADLTIPIFAGLTASGPPTANVPGLDSPDTNVPDLDSTGQGGNESADRDLDTSEPDDSDAFELEGVEDRALEVAPGGELPNVDGTASEDEFYVPETELVPLSTHEAMADEAMADERVTDELIVDEPVEMVTDRLQEEGDTIPNEASMSEIEADEESASTLALPQDAYEALVTAYLSSDSTDSGPTDVDSVSELAEDDSLVTENEGANSGPQLEMGAAYSEADETTEPSAASDDSRLSEVVSEIDSLADIDSVSTLESSPAIDTDLEADSDLNTDDSLDSSSGLDGATLELDEVSAAILGVGSAVDASVDFNSSLDSELDAGSSTSDSDTTPDLDPAANEDKVPGPSVETSPNSETSPDIEPVLDLANVVSDEISEADTEPAVQVQPDLELWTDLVSEVVSGTDAQSRVTSSDSEAEETQWAQAGSNVRELLLATHWLNTLDPDWIGEEETSADETDSQATRSPEDESSDRSTPKLSVPTLLVNESLLKVHDLKFEVDSSAPLFRRLEAAELMNAAQLASVQTLWQQDGGQIATILQQETGLGMTTLNFFSDSLWSRHLARRKRIGEYLQEAELVSAREVQSTLNILLQEQKSIPLGVALAEQGLIRQTTADYFARSLVQRARSISEADSPETKSLQIPKNIELAATRGGCSVCVVTLWGRLERRPRKQLRQSLFDAAELYSPNVLVDMSLVTSVDMPSLRAIVAAANRCRALRGQLCLCGISADVQLFLRNQSTQLGLKSFPNRRIAIEYFPIL